MGKLRWGAVRALPSGKHQARYPFQGELIPADRTFDTRGEALDWLETKKAAMRQGLQADPHRSVATLSEWYPAFISDRVTPLRGATIQDYETLFRCHMEPWIGKVQIGQFSKGLVKKWLGDLTRAGRSETRRHKAYTLLVTMLNVAVEDGILAVNPAKLKDPPQRKTKERTIVGPDKVIELAEAIDPQYRAMVYLGAFMGLRIGEVLGLTPSRVDLLHGTVRVDQAVYPLAGGLSVGPPKTEAGIRTLPIPEICVEPLRTHMERMGSMPAESFFFRGTKGKTICRRTFYDHWNVMRNRLGLPARFCFHDLRHCGQTWAAQIPGVTVRDLMVRAGHSDPKMAIRYMHSSNEQQQKIADALSALAVSGG